MSLSFGIFLFVLFFQPFPLANFDFNNQLLFVAGLAAIVFVMMVLRIIFSHYSQEKEQASHGLTMLSNLGDLLFLAMISVAFAFYLRYVGIVSITFYTMFRIVLISSAPLVILRIYEAFRKIRYQNELLVQHESLLQKQLEKYHEDFQSKSIEIISESRNENLKLQIADIAFFKSADNYVEIIHREADQYKRELIRSTMRNIEQQLKPYSNFIRCHRTCIVNIHYARKLNSRFNNYWLTLRDIDEKIPISRQYLLSVRENL